MNLNHLRTFVEVWRTRSISRASANLNITQPAASGQIRSLEAEIGHALFRRHARGVEPTVIANELAAAIGGGLDEAEVAVERLRQRSDDLVGVVRMAGPAEFMGQKMPPVASELITHGIELHVRLGTRDAIYHWFSEETIELAITASEPSDPALGFQAVFEENLLVVAAPGLKLKGPPRGDWPWLAYDDSLPMIRSYLASFHADIPSRTAMTAGSLTFLRDCAVAGAGVTILPDYLCRGALETGALTIVDQRVRLPINRIFLVWRKATLRLPRVVLARDTCLELLHARR